MSDSSRSTGGRSERIAIPLEVRWQDRSGTYRARTGDLSVGGCFVESSAPVELNQRIFFELQLPTGRNLLLSGEVVHLQPPVGFGVRFHYVNEQARTILAEVIKYARGME
jgi:Tfp pilus assembly protein PilZ